MFRSMSGFKAQYHYLTLLVISEFNEWRVLLYSPSTTIHGTVSSAKQRPRNTRWPLPGRTFTTGSMKNCRSLLRWRGCLPLPTIGSSGVNTPEDDRVSAGVLEQNGLEVYLVNARHAKNLPGRKSDVVDRETHASDVALRRSKVLDKRFGAPEEGVKRSVA